MYARIQSLIRRYKKVKAPEVGKVDSDFTLDEKRHQIFLKNEPINLTPAEFEILEYMLKQHGFSISREQLYIIVNL